MEDSEKGGEWQRAAVEGKVGICVTIASNCEKKAINLAQMLPTWGGVHVV